VAAALGAVTAPGQAQDNIRLTKHNLSAGSRDPTFNNLGLADYGEVCSYCHTPHGGQTQAPLWNRAFGTGPYQMYASPTINMTIDPAPGQVSLACLSCHDGTIGLDVIINRPNSSSATATGRTLVNVYGASGTADTIKILGVDLRNDHPVGVNYDETRDVMFNSAAAITSGGLRLYNGKVECASCHNPHDRTNLPFLRKSNAGSAVCLTCHIK
jgi:predicted CXXCH cytochrome family protein